MAGIRTNGLSADAYVAVADLDPSTADALLATLRERGVAAYAAVSPDVTGPDHDGSVDRLYVDVDAEAVVRTLIDEEVLGSGGGPEPDVEAQFRAIIAGFDTTHEPSVPGYWPAAEDIDPLDDTTAGAPDPGSAGLGAGNRGAYLSWEHALRPEVASSADEVEDRYVPPPPPPLPHAPLRTRLAWLAAVGGPVVLFLAVMLDWQLQAWELLLAVLAFLGGFVALVAQLGNHRDDNSGDDGAVV